MPGMKIEGMHCPNCVAAVKKALESLPGATGVEVDLIKGEARWEAIDATCEEIREAVEDLGFDVKSQCCGKCGCEH